MSSNTKLHNYKGYISCIKGVCPAFRPTGSQRKLITALTLYFSRNIEFETKGFGKLNKGILLAGNVGTGKSLLMLAAQGNPRAPFKCHSTMSVTDAYQQSGIEGIRNFCHAKALPYNGYKAYCFDDLGCEPQTIKHMGNELNVMARIILERYEYKNLIPFHLTHFTTNLSADQIGTFYGKRVLSRLHEMCNLFVLEGDDQRMMY